MVGFGAGRTIAAMIPNARFVPLESKNHILLEDEPAWPRFLTEVRRFLGVEAEKTISTSSSSPASHALDTDQWDHLSALFEHAVALPPGERGVPSWLKASRGEQASPRRIWWPIRSPTRPIDSPTRSLTTASSRENSLLTERARTSVGGGAALMCATRSSSRKSKQAASAAQLLYSQLVS